MNSIIFSEVTKNYGKVQGIANVTLNIESGVTGILGLMELVSQQR